MDTDNPHVKTALRTIVMEPTLMRNIQILCAETEHDIVWYLLTKFWLLYPNLFKI